MRKYQDENGINGRCVDNVQTYYDILKPYLKDKIKVKAVFVVIVDTIKKVLITATHLIILFDDTIVEPSYEYSKIKDTEYYDTIANFKERCFKCDDLKKIYKERITTFLKFVKIADEMNQGIFRITDKAYYHNQLNFIEKENHIIMKNPNEII
jgi:hypothetical protein